MGLDAMKDQPELDDLRLRVERLEREVSALSRERDTAVQVIERPVPPPPEIGFTPPPPAFTTAAPKASMEDRLGSQWFSRIGILALLIATALFLKLAIDNHWIGPLGRTIVGLAGGAAIIVWSERFRRSGVTAFSFALKAIGSGVLYLTLWAAFQLYGLMPAPVVFGAMLLVTAWNAYMAWSQDAELLAAYAMIGAFATPALLSTGVAHEVFLFSYILAIDLAVIALVRLKPWPRLLVAAFLPTVAYYSGWYFGSIFRSHPFAITTLFVSLFFVAFAAASTRFLRRETVGSSAIADVFLPLANAIVTALALYLLLDQEHLRDWTPWVAVLLAAIYLGLMRVSRSAVSASIHLSLAILFLTVAIPLKATGHGIVIGWLAEGAALLWVSARLARQQAALRIRSVLRWLGCGALALGFVSVVSLPVWLRSSFYLEAFTNERFATGLVASAAFGLAIWIAVSAHKATPTETNDPAETPSWIKVAAVSVVAFNLVTIWTFVQEIDTLWRRGAFNAEASLRRDLAVSGFLMVYGAALLAVGFRKRRAFVRWQALILLVFTIAKTFLFDMSSLSQGYRVASFFGLGAILMGVSFAYQKDWLELKDTAASSPSDPRP